MLEGATTARSSDESETTCGEPPKFTEQSDPHYLYGQIQSLACLPMFSEDVEARISELMKRATN